MTRSCVSVRSCCSITATTPATMGDENDVPNDTACSASTCWHVGSFVSAAHDGPAKMLAVAVAEGTACCERAPTIAAPGAMMSGFASTVSVGPAPENQHGSPGEGSLVAPLGSTSPPAASSKGTLRPRRWLSTSTHEILLMVQPTAMSAGCVDGRLTVLSRT